MQIKSVYFLITLLLLSCNQNNKEEKCEEQYNRAKDYLNEYYLTNNKDYLNLLRLTIDSINCDTFRYSLSGIKITLYLLMEDYESGIVYLDSLLPDKFAKPYSKNMYLNSFKALICEKDDNTICRNDYYKQIENEIEKYIRDKIDKEALVDLYFIKSKIHGKEILLNEIDSLKTINQYDTDYLDVLHETINKVYYSSTK